MNQLKSPEDFLSMIANKSTKGSYKTGLKHFFNFVNLPYNEYLADGRAYFDDLRKFAVWLINEKFGGKSIQLYITAVTQYLLENDIELSRKQSKKIWNMIKGSSNGAAEVPRDISTYRKILSQMDLHGRAMFLVQLCGGCRPEEVVQITLDDLDLAYDPPRIHVKAEYTKTRKYRPIYLTPETKEHLELWLAGERDRYLKSSKKGFGIGKAVDYDRRVFPHSENVLYQIWNTALEKAGLAKFVTSRRVRMKNGKAIQVRRRTITPHGIRKFTRKKLGSINRDLANSYIGWKTGNVGDDIYGQGTVEEVEEFFKRSQHLLTVFGDTAEATRLREELSRLSEYNAKIHESNSMEITRLRDMINDVRTDKNRVFENLGKILKEKGITDITAEELLEKAESEVELEKLLKNSYDLRKIFG